MDPQVINILVGLGVIYCVATILLMVAMVRTAHNVLQAATNSVNAVEGLRANIRDQRQCPNIGARQPSKTSPPTQLRSEVENYVFKD